MPPSIGAQLARAARVAASQAERHAGRMVAERSLAPAAVRLERTRSRGGDTTADQVAVTVWFGAGPALPALNAPGWAVGAVRGALRVGAGAVAVAALAAASTMAGRLEERRPVRIVDARPGD